MSGERRQWHLDKTVSLGHVGTTLILAVTGGWWFVENEGRMRDMEVAAKYNDRRLTQVEQTQITQAEWISTKLEAIRLEQREDIMRLSDMMSAGFIRLEKKLDSKADK